MGHDLGGIELSFFFPPWHMEGQIWDGSTVFFVAFIILPGTLIPFYLFMESLHHNTPTESSLLANIEPLTAAIVSAIWLQAPMGFFEILGGLCIIGTVTLLTFQSDKKHDMSG